MSNVATVRFSDANGNAYAAVSDTASFTVLQKAALDLEPARTVTVGNAAVQVVFPHVLTNLGNGDDAFTVSATSARGWTTRVLHDVDGNGALSAADTVLTSAIPLGMDEAIPILVDVQMGDALGAGETEEIEVRAVSTFDGTVSDALIDRITRSAAPNGTVTKSVDLSRASPGETLTYQLRFRYAGVASVLRAELVDTLPNNVTWSPGSIRVNGVPNTDADDGDLARFDPLSRTVEVVSTTLAPNTDVVVEFQVAVAADANDGAPIENTGALSLDVTSGRFTTLSNRVITEVVIPEPTLTKTVAGPNPAQAGDTLRYAIRLTNPSDRPLIGLEVLDTIPEPLTVLETDSIATVDDDGVVRWTVPQVAPGDSIELQLTTLVGEISDSSTVVNRAVASLADSVIATAESPPTGLLPTDDPVQLDLSKEVDRTRAQRGDRLRWTLQPTADGFDFSTGSLTLVDPLPAEVTLVEGSIRIGGSVLTSAADGDAATYDPGTRTLRIEIRNAAALAGPITFSADIRNDVALGTVITNTASAVLERSGGTETASSQTTSTRVDAPLVGSTKTVTGPNPATRGDTLVYTIDVRNPDDALTAREVVVIDTVPEGLTVLGTSPGAASIDGRVVRWDLGDLPPLTTVRLELTTGVELVADTIDVVNRVSVLDPFGRRTTSQSEPTTLTPGIGISIDKTVDRTLASADDLLTYELRLTAGGFDGNEDRLRVVDTLPASVTFEPGSITLDGRAVSDASDGDEGSYDPTTRVLELDFAPPGPAVDAVVRFQARVDQDVVAGTSIVNRAHLSLDTPLGVLAQAADTAVTRTAIPDLLLRKTVSADTAVRGDTLIYRIEVENPTTDLTAFGLEVGDRIPDELVIVGTSPNGTVDGQRVSWTVDRLDPGQIASFEIATVAILVDGVIPVINQATLSQGGVPTDTVSTGAVIVSSGIGLRVDKTVDRTVASAGDLLTYDVRLRANRLVSTDRVFAVDTIPAAVEWVAGSVTVDGVPATDAADGDGIDFDPSTRILTYREETPDSLLDRTLRYQVRIPANTPGGTRIVNRATLGVDAVLGFHDTISAPVETITELPDLVVTKTVEGDNPSTVGDTLRWTIDVANPTSDLQALGLELVDTLPDDVTFLDATPAPTVDGRVLRWGIDRLGPGESRRFEILTEAALVEDSVSIANRAILTQDGAPVAEALSDSIAIVSPDTASISLRLESELLEVQIGQALPLRVTLTNDGESTIRRLSVKLSIPEEARFLEGQTLLGTFVGFRSAPDQITGDGLEGAALRNPNLVETPIQLDSFTVENDTLTVWVPGELRPEEEFRFRYQIVVERAPEDGQLITIGSAEGRRGSVTAVTTGRVVASNTAAAQVILGRNRPLETRTTIGKVFHDMNGNGRQDRGEAGVAGVDIWTEDGELVTSDGDGKFSFENLRPGRHAFRLDPRSIREDLRASGTGAERGLRVLETNGWNSGRLSFPLLSIATRVRDAQVPIGAMASTCVDLQGLVDADALTCAPTDDADLLALASELLELRAAEQAARTAEVIVEEVPIEERLAPITRIELVPDSTGWPDASFELPPGWTLVPGSSALADGTAVDPEVIASPDGTEWLRWRDLDGGPESLSVLLWQGELPAEERPDPVTVAPMRTDSLRAGDERNAFIFGPAIAVVSPADGSVIGTNRLYIGVQGEASMPVGLFRGDSLLVEQPLYPNGVGDFLGIEVPEGPNTFRIRMRNSWGQERWDSITVHRSGAPAALVPEVDVAAVTADGRSVERIRVRVLDQWGVPVVTGPMVTVRMDGALPAGEDDDLISVGHQIQADPSGWLTVPVLAGREAGEGTVLLEYGGVETEIPLVLAPPIRPLLLTGVGQVSLGAGGQNFGALTARGRLNDETSITLSYDSRALDAGQEVFGRLNDPLGEGNYALLGDASEQRSLTPARYNFAARVERGRDWFMLGDVQTSGFSDGLTLGRYSRALPGAAGSVTLGGIRLDGFGATTTQALRQAEIRGNGSSGPFDLGGGVLPGTEQISVQTRALANPTRIVSDRTLTRFVDYQIDYERGTVLLKQPLPAADPSGNPVFLMILFEGESGGDRSAVVGLRATGNANRYLGTALDSIPLSIAVVNDDAVGNEFRMASVSGGIVQRNGLRLRGEVALTEGMDSTGVATRLDATMPLFGDRVTLDGSWMKVGDEFRNPANIALRPGTEEVRASASANIGGSRISLNHERQSFELSDLSRNRTTMNVVQPLTSKLRLEAQFAGDAASRQGVEQNTGGGEYKLAWQALDRLELFAEGRNQLWTNGAPVRTGSYFGGGASFRLSNKLSLEGRHIEVTPTDGRDGYAVSSIGVTSNLRVGTRAWGNYQLIGGNDGTTNAAVVGLNHQFTLGNDWRFSSLFERRRGVAGAQFGDPVLASPFEQPEEDYISYGLGTEYVPQGKPYRLTFRAENRDGGFQSQQLGTLAGDLSINSALAILTRQEFIQREQVAGGTTQFTRERSSLWGLAYRPTETDELNVLFKFEWRDALNPFGNGVLTTDGRESRLIGQAEAIWAPTAAFEFGARYAARTARQDAQPVGEIVPELRSETQFFGVRSIWTLTPWLGMRTEARGLFSGLTSTSEWDVAPAAIFRPFNGIEIEGGYRFGGLQDPDFAVRTGQGWYLSFGTRITELTLPNAANFWRNRF